MLPFKKILCPIDFSEPSYAALQVAADLAMQFDAELCVLHVMAPLDASLAVVMGTKFDESRSADAAHKIHMAVQQRLDKSVRTRAVVATGGPAAEILRAAEEEAPSVIVIATRGESGWRHFIFGSVAEAVVRLARQPVFTVHGPLNAEKDEPAKPKAAEPAFSHPLNPWEVNEKNFPATAADAEKLLYLLNYAVLAPSHLNAQPWLWKLDGSTLELYADRTRTMPIADPRGRQLIIGCGGALFNLRLAIRHFGYRGEVEYFPDPKNMDLLARVSLGARLQDENRSHEELALFEAIHKRHTNRMRFEDRELPASVRQELKDAARGQGAVVRFIGDGERDAVLDLIQRGDAIQSDDKDFRRELAAWVRPNDSLAKDGIPGTALGLKGVASHLAPLAIRGHAKGKSMAFKELELAANAPAFALLETEDDTPRAWLTAGQALNAVLLRASANGVHASFFNQPMEMDGLLRVMHLNLGLSLFPQMLFRLGYAARVGEVKPTPRRPVDEILVKNLKAQQALEDFVAANR